MKTKLLVILLPLLLVGCKGEGESKVTQRNGNILPGKEANGTVEEYLKKQEQEKQAKLAPFGPNWTRGDSLARSQAEIYIHPSDTTNKWAVEIVQLSSLFPDKIRTNVYFLADTIAGRAYQDAIRAQCLIRKDMEIERLLGQGIAESYEEVSSPWEDCLHRTETDDEAKVQAALGRAKIRKLGGGPGIFVSGARGSFLFGPQLVRDSSAQIRAAVKKVTGL